MIRKKIDYYMVLLTAVNALMCILIFYRISRRYFYIAMGGDIFQQYIHFFNMFHDLVRSGEFPFWSWTYGPGGSFWNDFGYYMLGDIFIWPLLLLPKAWFPYTFIPISMLKILLISLGTYMLLKRLGVKRGIALMAGITGSYALFNFEHFYTHYFFLNATVYFPFILLGYERLLSEKKGGVLFITLFLASISNFYFLFMITIGLFIYSIFRYFTYENTEKKFKPFLLFHIKLALFYLLSLGTAMVFFLPSVFSFVQSSAFHRHGQHVLDNVLSLDALVRMILWKGGMNFLPLLSIPLYLLNRNKRTLMFGAMGFVLVIILVLQDLYSAVAGFSNPAEFRGLFLFNLLLTIVAAISLNEFDFKKPKNIIALLVMSGLIYFWLDRNPFTHYASYLKLTPVIFVVLFIASQFLKNNWVKKGLFSLSAVAVMGYSLMLPYSFVTDVIISSGGGVPGPYHKGVWGIYPLMNKVSYTTYFNNPEVKNTVAQIKDDKSLYRVDMNAAGLVFYNSSMSYDYRSYVAYQSLLKWNLQYYGMDYLGQAGSRSLSWINGYPNNTFVSTILNIKYAMAMNGSAPSNLYGYKTIYQNGKTIIKKNQYPLPIGFIYNTAISEAAYNKADYTSRDELLLRNAVVSKADMSGLSSDESLSVKTIGSLEQAAFDTNTNVKKEKDGLLINSSTPIELTIPVDDHPLSELTVYADIHPYTPNQGITINASNNLGANYVFEKNMKSNQYQVTQYHFTETTNKVLFRFGQDDQTKWIKLTVQPGKFLVKNVMVSTSSYRDYKDLVKGYQKNSLKDVKYGNNFVNGDYTSSKKGILFLSIPYSTGWTATIDGKKVRTFTADYAFTGIHAPAGKHHVELKFRPEGFIPGLLVSLISLGIAIYLLIIRKRPS